MVKVKHKKLNIKYLKNKKVIIPVIFAVIGIAILVKSLAATPFASIEPESGTLSGNASAVSDASASGGKYLQFNGSTSPTSWWKPPKTTRWNWVLEGSVNTTNTTELNRFDMYDIDLRDAIPATTTQTVTWPSGYSHTYTWTAGENAGVIAGLKAKGKKVICYIDTGGYESYRPDAGAFPGSATHGNIPYTGDPSLASQVVIGGKSLDANGTAFPGEWWLDQRLPAVQNVWGPIMWARMDLAKKIGCDGLEGDQNNAYGNDSTFGVTQNDSLRLYREVFYQLHKRGLTALIKNGQEITAQQTTDPTNISYCTPGLCIGDGYLTEECGVFTNNNNQPDCVDFDVPLSKGIWVGEAEYANDIDVDITPTVAHICTPAKAAGRMAMIKPDVDLVQEGVQTLCWELP